MVILNGFQAVKDGMTTHPEDVSGRLMSPFFKALAKGKGEIFLPLIVQRNVDLKTTLPC